MNIQFWLIAAISIIIAYNLARAFSKTFKEKTRVISSILTVLFIISSIFAVIIYLDVKKLSDTFPKTTQLFIYDDNNKVPIAFTIMFKENSASLLDNLGVIKGTELSDINSNYQKGNYNAVLGSNYKLFIITRSLMQSALPDSMDIMQMKIPKEKMLNMISSDNSLDYFIDIVAEQQGVIGLLKPLLKSSILDSLKLSTDSDFKTTMFALSFFQGISGGQAASPLDNIRILEAYRKGTLIIYPETIFFKGIKLIPLSMVYDAAKLI